MESATGHSVGGFAYPRPTVRDILTWKIHKDDPVRSLARSFWKVADRTKLLGRQISGVRIPDSKLASEATELVREVSSTALFNHVFRTYLFAQLIDSANHIQCDSETLFLAAILHDLGLTARFQGNERFEVDGADAAYAFLKHRDVPDARAQLVWDAIALHTSAGIAHRKQPEIALVHLGVGTDVIGLRVEQIPARLVAEVLEAFPRLQFKRAFMEALTTIAREKPQSAAFNFVSDIGRRYIPGIWSPDICELISTAPFSD